MARTVSDVVVTAGHFKRLLFRNRRVERPMEQGSEVGNRGFQDETMCPDALERRLRIKAFA